VSKAEKTSVSAIERRRSRRRPVLRTFSIFAVVPRKGVHRLFVHDVSDMGIGFDFDTEGEEHSQSPVVQGDTFELRLYLNQSLYLPLSVQVKRIEDGGAVRRIGAEFNQRDSAGYKAFLAFLHMLDAVVDAAEIEQQPA